MMLRGVCEVEGQGRLSVGVRASEEAEGTEDAALAGFSETSPASG
jgi:hypothetical protein